MKKNLLFSLVLSQCKKHYSTGKLKYNNLGISQSFLRISLKLNFTPNTLGSYGLKMTRNNARRSQAKIFPFFRPKKFLVFPGYQIFQVRDQPEGTLKYLNIVEPQLRSVLRCSLGS